MKISKSKVIAAVFLFCLLIFAFSSGAAKAASVASKAAAAKIAGTANKWAAASRPEGNAVYTVPLDSIPVLKTVLPKKSENYTIDPVVTTDGYFYHFKIRTPHGDYNVTSVRKLIKRCHEIDVMEEFSKTERGSEVWKGVGQSFAGVGRGLGRIITHPGQSAKRVGSGTARFFRATGSIFRRKKPVLASDGTDLALLGKGPAGGERRVLAYEWGIDVYTRNEVAKAMLMKIAKQRFSGKLPIGATVFALPGGAVFTLSLTPMGYDASTEELIRDNSPDSLRRVLARRYFEMFNIRYGKPDSPTTQLLDNMNYTPREQAYLWRYLTDLKDLEGINKALAFLGRVGSPAQASIVSAQVELLSLLHVRAKPLQRFVPIHNTLGALAKDGTLCLVISIDTVRYQGDVPKSLELSINAAKEYNAKKIIIWSTGDIDRKSVALANSMGVTVYQNILEQEIFNRPREEQPQAPAPGKVAKKAEKAKKKQEVKPAANTAPPQAAEDVPVVEVNSIEDLPEAMN